MNEIILHPKKEESIKRFHPWIFSGAIARKPESIASGDTVRVLSSGGDFLGIGHYGGGSIAVRLFSFADEPVDEQFWQRRLQQALNMRLRLNLISSATNVCRLVNGEGDLMPGLIVDYYNGAAVIQTHSTSMFLLRPLIARLLIENPALPITSVYDKSEKTLTIKNAADRIRLNPQDGYLVGNCSIPHTIREHDNLFEVNWEEGQKTGFFIDQRENRRLLQHYAADRDVLNMFCYTGGFSVYALRGNARSVCSVDASSKAIELTDRNVALNFPDAPHSAVVADAFEFLHNSDNCYDLIILDPPAFAKRRFALRQALQAYKRLNAKALDKIRSGGLLFTFSCSQVVPKESFREAVFSAAAIAGRYVRILHQMEQPADHPVNIFHPESEYLKGLVLWVE
ncbi:MAG: class I SAM-dependent rRNA methyltransferase [Bacteroidales bacterium]|jgi:23S rRNA (cytosine1962-C5)-methyltransferase|nr:class I SAM-dependent rRNA methyltransferase [Bacteroidales bacterium]